MQKKGKKLVKYIKTEHMTKVMQVKVLRLRLIFYERLNKQTKQLIDSWLDFHETRISDSSTYGIQHQITGSHT